MQTWKWNPMRAEKRHAGETAKVGGARALAGIVKIVTAANVALSAGGCAYALGAETVAPAAGLALAAIVSAFMLKGGAA